MSRDGSYNICQVCLDFDDDCPLCPCGKHAILFGADTQFCLDCRDPCINCNEQAPKGKPFCSPCHADSLACADTLRPAVLELVR
jgi:hypothetical protein